MKAFKMGVVSLLCVMLCAGCGTVDPEAQARMACPTLPDAEFNLLLGALQFDRQNGVSFNQQIGSIPSFCFTAGITALFNTDGECRACFRALIDAAYAP